MKISSFIILLFFALTNSFNVSSQELDQETSVEISGRIIDAETKAPVPYVHIIHKALGKGTVSNSEGRFSIKMNKMDTLVFSAIGFESYAFTLKEKVQSDKLVITIELNT